MSAEEPTGVVIRFPGRHQDVPWTEADAERASLCDHKGTYRTTTETCQCGHTLIVMRHHAEDTGGDE